MTTISRALILALAIPSALAGEGVVTVLETPLFTAPDARSPVAQYARKGDKLYLHEQDMNKSPEEPDYERYDPDRVRHEHYDLVAEDRDGFYRSVDKNGHTVWVFKSHVKPITNDQREELTPIRPFKRDPTDYRLAEPLPPDYPLYDPDHYRAGILLTMAPSEKRSYPYPADVTEERYASRSGVDLFYTKKVSFDPYARLFFGGSLTLAQERAQISLANNTSARETRYRLGIGPMISYDFYRDGNWRLASLGGVSLMHDGHKIIQQRGSRSEDERSFTGTYFSPHAGLQLHRKQVMPSIDLVAQAQTQVDLPHSVKSTDTSNYDDQWNSPVNETLKRPLRLHFSVGLGLQATY